MGYIGQHCTGAVQQPIGQLLSRLFEGVQSTWLDSANYAQSTLSCARALPLALCR